MRGKKPKERQRYVLRVNETLVEVVENGLEVSEAHTCEESLEDYFKRVTGGEGIA